MVKDEPITVLVPRTLKRWLGEQARKEGKKLGPYVREVLWQHHTRVQSTIELAEKES